MCVCVFFFLFHSIYRQIGAHRRSSEVPGAVQAQNIWQPVLVAEQAGYSDNFKKRKQIAKTLPPRGVLVFAPV